MKLIRLAAFVMKRVVAACHSEILPASKDIMSEIRNLATDKFSNNTTSLFLVGLRGILQFC